MTTELTRIRRTDWPILANMFQFYLHDMSEFAGWPVSDDGTFQYPADLLAPYWEKADHHPYFIMHKGEVAGFSLVRRFPGNERVWDMGQFFVLRKFRGTGIGRLAFAQSLAKYPGQWQVRVLPENKPAYRFWKTQINDVSGGVFTEAVQGYGRIEMTFFAFGAVG